MKDIWFISSFNAAIVSLSLNLFYLKQVSYFAVYIVDIYGIYKSQISPYFNFTIQILLLFCNTDLKISINKD